MILVSFFSEDNALFDEIKICHIFEYESNKNLAFRFFGDTQYTSIALWKQFTSMNMLSVESQKGINNVSAENQKVANTIEFLQQ